MALGGQMDDAVHLFLLHQLIYTVEVADVHFYELVVGLAFHVLQVGQVARVGELIEVDDIIFRVLVHKQAHHMAAYESGSAGDNDVSLHGVFRSFIMAVTPKSFLYCVGTFFFIF